MPSIKKKKTVHSTVYFCSRKIFKLILILIGIILFLSIIIRCLFFFNFKTHFSRKNYLGKIIGKNIVLEKPVSPKKIKNFSNCVNNEENKKNFLVKNIEVKAPDGIKLETIEIKLLNNKQNEKYLINFNGRGCIFQDKKHIEEAFLISKGLPDTTILEFNYRGTGNSEGIAYSKDDLVIDGISQIQSLLDRGIKPENITIRGYSLGGSIATLVVEHFNNKGIKLKLFNDRSFSSLTKVISGRVRTLWKASDEENIFGKVLDWVSEPFVEISFNLTNWEINVVDSFKKIPEEYKELIAIQSTDDAIDGSITNYASLYRSLESETDSIEKKRDSSLTYKDVAEIKYGKFFKKKLHHEPLISLKDCNGVSGLQKLINFANKEIKQ